MNRLEPRPDPLMTLLARLRPLLVRLAVGTMAAFRGIEEKLRAVDWAGGWQRFREDPRPVPQKLASAADEALSASRVHPVWDQVRRAWTWAVLHDTVPNEAIARRREWWAGRQQRHEQREADRQYRKEETAKKREKKDEEERQTYSVYFE